jgi:uncharacterized protein
LNLRFCLLAIVLSVSAAVLNAAETPIPPPPTRWVTDTANFMSMQAARTLDARLEEYSRGTGHQLLVWIGTTTDGPPIEDWAVRAFKEWQVGRKGIDDGLVLFIMSEDRRLRIEVGYGLEGEVPDVVASRIINDVIVPRVQAGDRDGAVSAGMDAVMSVIGGQGLPGTDSGREVQPVTLGQLIVYLIIGGIFLIVLITNPSLAMYLLANILFSGRHGRGGRYGGGGFGGGFRGGGGRSGGGGASGSW